MTTPNLVLSQGWYISKNPDTGALNINIPEIGSSSNAVFKKFGEEQDVWLKETDNVVYVLDWQSNARVIYEKHLEKCDCPDVCVMIPIPDNLLNFVMLPLEDTREIMDNICD
jgi:hypothetical protein